MYFEQWLRCMKINRSLAFTKIPSNIKAFLFDLDGVLLDTEGKYLEFWEQIALEYKLDVDKFPIEIKGKPIDAIVNEYFKPEKRTIVRQKFFAYEEEMQYEFFPGALNILKQCRDNGIRTAIVTSSDAVKMAAFYRQYPSFKSLVDIILTADDFDNPKPAPDCWLKAASLLDTPIKECAVFEDSINGLKSAQASKGIVFGVSTTLPSEEVSLYSNFVINIISEILL